MTFKRLCLVALLCMPVIVSGHFIPAARAQNAAPGYVQEQQQGTSFVAPSGTVIQNIEVVGTQRIEPATVLTYLDVKVGDQMTQEALDGALKNLFATGLFADVTLRQKGSTLEVAVVENPVINEIAFEGNDRLKDEDLLAEIQLRPRQVFTKTKVQADTSRLYQLYRRNGRFAARVEPKVIKLDQNRVNLVFEIDEGAVTYIKSINFVGNKHYSSDRLRSEISTSETHWYKFLSNDDRYDPDRLAYDQELLRKFYLSKGYGDFRVISAVAELAKSKDYFYITITVEEGDRYKVRNVNVSSSLRDVTAAKLDPYVTMKSGEWYDAEEVQKTIDKMTAALADLNIIFVTIQPDVQKNRDSHTIDITFNVQEAPKVFVERIDITGNMRTMDKVIRREMTLVEGDAFDKAKLAKSEQRLKDLGFFEDVKVTTQQGSAPDKVVINVALTEKSTGELSIGAGFSTEDGPLADFTIREKNFLGKGQDLMFDATVAGKRSQFDISFTEPYFLDRDMSAGFTIFHSTRDLQSSSSYDQKRTGGSLQLGYPLSEHWRQTVRYRIENNEITNVQSNASIYIQAQEGKRLTSALSQTVNYDTRDSKLFPTTGVYSWLTTEAAGLGGDAKYLSGRLGGIYYYPVYEDQVVLDLMGEGGIIHGIGSNDVKINERFFLGGTTMRGFEVAGLGPRDTAADDSLGGNRFYRGSIELAFPVGLPDSLGVQGHAFTDFGSLWQIDDVVTATVKDENSLRASAGFGISWRSPMGPVRVDLAQPYIKKDYDKTQVFNFSFGTRF